MSIWMILLVILLLLFVLLWLASLQPVWLKLRLSAEGVEVEIKYLGFTARPHMKARSEDEDEDEDKDELKPQKKSKKRLFGAFVKLVPDITSAATSAGRYLLSHILIKRLRASGALGFEDPATTGMAYGLYQAGLGWLPFMEQFELDITPNFADGTTSIEGEFEGGIRPSSVIASGAILMWRLPKLKLIRAMRA